MHHSKREDSIEKVTGHVAPVTFHYLKKQDSR